METLSSDTAVLENFHQIFVELEEIIIDTWQ